MKLAVFAYSRQGCKTAGTIIKKYAGHEIRAYTMERFSSPGFSPLEKPSVPFYGAVFSWADAMIFVGSCGIAVRQIAPHVRDKKTDPAVLCIDELGRYVIPLLSGHIGGANQLAAELADELQAVPVITTATDINDKFSVDAWAARNGFHISNMVDAKAVSAGILEKPIPLCSDFPVVSPLPKGTQAGQCGELGIYLTWSTKSPFSRTLRLIPQVIHLGIGCRKDTPEAAIAAAVETVFREHYLDFHGVKSVASIDLKAHEAGLLSYCKKQNWPITFYTAQQLQQVKGDFTPSSFVKSITGVDNVCERSALLDADHLIVRKTALNGVTVAVAVEKLEVNFG